MATLGGPANSVSVVADGRVRAGGPALPVAVVTDGRAVEGDAADPVYVVTSGPIQGGPALPIVETPVYARIKAGPAQPVFVVSGAFVLAYSEKVYSTAPQHLLAYWPLAETSGTTIVDESGNNRNGVYKAAGEPLLGQTGIGDGRTAPLFDGTNDFGNVFTTGLQSAFNPAEGTLQIWMKVSAAGDWTDATTRRPMYFQTDANNRVRFEKTTTNNQLAAVYIAGGTNKTVLFTTSAPTGWVHLAQTWSKSADQYKFYVAGVQVGTTQTGLGTWVGTLSATSTTVGAADTIGSNPWKGYLAHAAVWNTPLSAAQIAQLAVVP